MKTNDIFPSKYLKAADLPEEGSQTFTIEKVTVEEIGKDKERKPVVHFDETDKSMVCNKTNWNTIAKVAGSDDSDYWRGKKISLGRAEVEAFGEMVEAIRVRTKTSKQAVTDGDDEIPF